ncbi:MAG: transglutaminase family protein, partial [Planctomycetota bacterium]
MRFVHELHNRGKRTLEDIRLGLVLPPELSRQEILLLRVSPGSRIVRDGHGNRVALFERRRLDPGRMLVAQWFATVRLREVTALPGRECLPAEKRELYLRDRPVYCLTDRSIQELARLAVEGSQGGLDRVRGIHRVVLELLSYKRDGRWDSAPICLAKGEGSCSEHSYCFIALARASGLPSRFVGGLSLLDAGAPVYEDRIFHRWAEVWLPELGWFPVDCSRDDRAELEGRKPALGRTRWNLLVLARGDGGEQSLTGFNYHSL